MTSEFAVGDIIETVPHYGRGKSRFFHVIKQRTPKLLMAEELAQRSVTPYAGDSLGGTETYALAVPLAVVDGKQVRVTASKEFGWSIKGARTEGSERYVFIAKVVDLHHVYTHDTYY